MVHIALLRSFLVVFLVVEVQPAQSAQPQPPEAASQRAASLPEIFFDQMVSPILSTHCLSCHRGAKGKAGLDLTQRRNALRGGDSGPAIVAGNARKSLLWQRIQADEMPPKKPLDKKSKEIIKRWIQNGAQWGNELTDAARLSTEQHAGYDWWSLKPLLPVKIPPASRNTIVVNEIDRFVQALLHDNGLRPGPRANPRVLIRRIHFDLLGLPAPPDLIDRFTEHPTQDHWERIVDELLDSRHYGERWARHWLDVARFGESHGYEYNVPRTGTWHYRDWIIRSLNRDLPYNQFAELQIAGDLVSPDSISGAAAVGFLVAGIHNTVLGKNPLMKLAARHDELEEMAGTVAQTFLGLTVNCARCHDHKFDPISTREYYQFIAALGGVTHGSRQITNLATPAARKKLRELEDKRDNLQGQLVNSIWERNGFTETATNQITLKEPTPANQAGVQYHVSLKIAPTVWATAAQATGARDGLSLRVVRQNGSLLASHYMKPGVWKNEQAGTFIDKTFTYRGDGTGRLTFQISAFPIHTNRFGACLDSITVTDESEHTVFHETFADLQHVHAPGSQVATRHKVFHGSSSRRWAHSGTGAIHAVEHQPGHFAVQFYSGPINATLPNPVATKEKHYQSGIESLNKEIDKLRKQFSTPVFTVIPAAPGIMRVLERGDVTNPGNPVLPGGLKAIAEIPSSFGLSQQATDAERRRKLAQWITHPKNGPFHRTIVNRIWHYHFGRGIVASPNDLGFNGGRPSHPALLDWLAGWFRSNGYSLKQLHRLIVNSATYQQTSNPALHPFRDIAIRTDQANRLLWRQNAQRVDAETLRDSILEIAGVLNRTLHGPGFKDVRIEKVGAAHYYIAIDPIGAAFNRRTIYRWQVRGERNSLLETFDCPDPSTTTPRRNVTTTPSQALSQWNHPFVLRMADHLAHRVVKDSGPQIAHQVDRMWKLVLGRTPDDEERDRAIQLVRKHNLTLLARVLFNCNEAILIE